MRYFNITRGLRGCYMPDDAWVMEAESPADLYDLAMTEIQMSPESEDCADEPDAVEWAHEAWDNPEIFDVVLPLGPGYGLGASVASANEYEEFLDRGET